MTSRRIYKSPGPNTAPIILFESSRVDAERPSLYTEETRKKNFHFHLPKKFGFLSKTDAADPEIDRVSNQQKAPEERGPDRLAYLTWLQIEREKARKELRMDQEGDPTETTTASESTAPSVTPKQTSSSSFLRISSYPPSIASDLTETSRKRDGKARRGRRSQYREAATEDASLEQDSHALPSPARGELGRSRRMKAECTFVSPDSGHLIVDASESSTRPVDDGAVNITPRRPRRRSHGPSRRQLRGLNLTSDDSIKTL